MSVDISANFYIIEATEFANKGRSFFYVYEKNPDDYGITNEVSYAKRFLSYDEAYQFIYKNKSKSPIVKGIDRFRTYVIDVMCEDVSIPSILWPSNDVGGYDFDRTLYVGRTYNLIFSSESLDGSSISSFTVNYGYANSTINATNNQLTYTIKPTYIDLDHVYELYVLATNSKGYKSTRTKYNVTIDSYTKAGNISFNVAQNSSITLTQTQILQNSTVDPVAGLKNIVYENAVSGSLTNTSNGVTFRSTGNKYQPGGFDFIISDKYNVSRKGHVTINVT